MQTNDSNPTRRVHNFGCTKSKALGGPGTPGSCWCDATPQPERFCEMTGGYDDVDHARAAKRLNADLRAMDATPRVGHDQYEQMRPYFKHSGGTSGTIYHRDGDITTATLTIEAHGGADRIGHLYVAAPKLLKALRDLLPPDAHKADPESVCGRAYAAVMDATLDRLATR